MAKQLSTKTKLCCGDCAHAKVCKHKKSAEALQKLIKDTIQFDENDSTFKISVECDCFVLENKGSIVLQTPSAAWEPRQIRPLDIKPTVELTWPPKEIPCGINMTTDAGIGDIQAN